MFSGFRPVTEDEVAAAVRALPNKQCATDMASQGMLHRINTILVSATQRISAEWNCANRVQVSVYLSINKEA